MKNIPNLFLLVNRDHQFVYFTMFSPSHVFIFETIIVATPLWDKCEDETHTPKSGKLESSGTPENSEFEFKGQNTLQWDVLYINGKGLEV